MSLSAASLSPLGDVLWRFPEFWCSLLCISFLCRQTVQHEPLWLCQEGTEREDSTSPSLHSLSSDGAVVPGEFRSDDLSIPPALVIPVRVEMMLVLLGVG